MDVQGVVSSSSVFSYMSTGPLPRFLATTLPGDWANGCVIGNECMFQPFNGDDKVICCVNNVPTVPEGMMGKHTTVLGVYLSQNIAS